MKIDSDIIQETEVIMTEDIKQKPRGFKGVMEDLGVNTFDELIDYMQNNPTNPLVQELEELLNKFY
mgnify:CR=1 FL=1